MTEKELLHLENTVTKRIGEKINDIVWIKAFEEYNEQRAYPLVMDCIGCYVKVFQELYQKKTAPNK